MPIVAGGDSSGDSSWSTEQLAVISRGLLVNVLLEYLKCISVF